MKLAPLALMLGTLAASMSVLAEAAKPDQPAAISPAERSDVVETLARKLQEQYVFPDVAVAAARLLKAHSAHGDYAQDADVEAFAKHLTRDLRAAGNDMHLHVFYDPQMVTSEGGSQTPPSPEMMDQMRAEATQHAWGVFAVERLPGNVGYLDLRGFEPIDFVAPYYGSAMSLLSGTDAMIIDLRRNGGGDPASVAYLLSFFFATGDERHLNDLYFRDGNRTREYWTNGAVTGRYTKPVYVLTSPLTFSGGEECAYDFQTQKRAVLVGEATGGGANPGDVTALGHGLVAFVPNGRAINPITHANWEHVGVKPDIEVKAADAWQRAYVEILRQLVDKQADPARHDGMVKLLARVEKGEPEVVDYSR